LVGDAVSFFLGVEGSKMGVLLSRAALSSGSDSSLKLQNH
jgi:hypothetical protein